MKISSKFSYVLLFLLLILPFVNADISLNENAKEIYNLGENFVVSGSIIGTRNMEAIIKFTLRCNNKSYQVGAQTIKLEADKEKEFSEELPLYKSGVCYAIVEVTDMLENVMFKAETDDFMVTGELEGEFDLNLRSFQLGDKIKLEGSVKRLDEKEVYGTALIFLKINDINYVVDSVDVNNGEFNYESIFNNLVPGKYDLYVKIIDNRGNEQVFDLGELDIENELIIMLNLERETGTYLPGEDLKLKVSSYRKVDNKESKGKLIVKFNNKNYVAGDVSEFDFKIPIADNIKSGKRVVGLVAEDEFGNYGENSVEIEILAVATRLEFDLDKGSYNSDENMKVTARLYDQAGDLIIKDLDLEVYDNKNKLVFEKTFMNDQEVIINLNDLEGNYGNWVIKVIDDDFIEEKSFSVSEAEGIEGVTGWNLRNIVGKGAKWIGILLLAFIVVGLLYGTRKFLKKPFSKRGDRGLVKYKKDKLLGEKRLKEIKSCVSKRSEIRKSDEKDIKDFREQMLKRIRQDSFKGTKSSYNFEKARERKITYPESKAKEEKKEEKGLFSMFD
jgi:hypothetical protein